MKRNRPSSYSQTNSSSSSRKRSDSGAKGRKGDSRGSYQDEAASLWAKRLSPAILLQGDKIHSGVQHTLSLAIPGSILRGAQTRELRSYLVGQIARAAVVHEVDEIIVFVDSAYEASASDLDKTPSVICCRLLQYLECPSYLRKALFPVHPDLALAGILPPLDAPHHMRREDVSLYREGVVVENKISETGCYVNVGLTSEAYVPRSIKPGIRLTVELDDPACGTTSTSALDTKNVTPSGEAVAPSKPRTKHGLYWGYETRLAKNFSEIFSECPYKGGYDMLIGHSTGGQDVDRVTSPPKLHILVVFGGYLGIESCIDADETLSTHGKNAASLFDFWLDLCPTQGSKAVRTEELVLTGLASLRPLFKSFTSAQQG
eukprot:GSChrysophyteH1.ASY1.ANO1.603.1 assembled CDS